MPDAPPPGPRSLPDPDWCHTRGMTVELSDCLVKQPQSCPHVQPFGNNCFCLHPDRRKFERKPKYSN